MLDDSLQELESRSLARIASAQSAEELEAVRVEVLGRKGALAQAGKDMGKLAPEDRKRAGMLLNGVKQRIEEALEASQREFAGADLRKRLDAEWLDLTLPAPPP